MVYDSFNEVNPYEDGEGNPITCESLDMSQYEVIEIGESNGNYKITLDSTPEGEITGTCTTLTDSTPLVWGGEEHSCGGQLLFDSLVEYELTDTFFDNLTLLEVVIIQPTGEAECFNKDNAETRMRGGICEGGLFKLWHPDTWDNVAVFGQDFIQFPHYVEIDLEE